MECHKNSDNLWLVAGQHRFIGLDRDCVTCHADGHDGRISRKCEECHTQEKPFTQVTSYEHEAFVARGSHAELECSACHKSDGPFAIARVSGTNALLQSRSCMDCHESPHSMKFLNGVARLTASTLAESCDSCHSDEHKGFSRQETQMPLALHSASGFDLEAPHHEIACDQCHTDPSGQTLSSIYPGRSANDCAACHNDVHAGEFDARKDVIRNGCSACHKSNVWSPTKFGLRAHAQTTSFPLLGAHEELSCRSCHAANHSGAPISFSNTPSKCTACHLDVHVGDFQAGAFAAHDCKQCHGFESFAPSSFGIEQHAQTDFPLLGSHEAVSCQQCHKSSGLRRTESPHREPGMNVHFGDLSSNCSDCHFDSHLGLLNSQTEANTTSNCSECHNSSQFSEVQGFDHKRYTGFALDGAHAAAACTECHRNPSGEDANGRVFGFAFTSRNPNNKTCAECHTSPHASSFDRPNLPLQTETGTSCARCHSADTFKFPQDGSFDHGFWTRYPIANFHASTSCAQCHLLQGGDSPGIRRSFKQLPSCSDCHSDPHLGQFDAKAPSDCSSCHLDEGGLRFDHNRDSRFQLDDLHSALDCSSCHIAQDIVGGGQAVRYKPLGLECKDCHGPVGPSSGDAK